MRDQFQDWLNDTHADRAIEQLMEAGWTEKDALDFEAIEGNPNQYSINGGE